MTGAITVVTGTNTGVGKTIATAALAARALASGERIVVVKPCQTGTMDGDSDARETARLTGAEVQEWTTLPEPLAPDTAARRAGVAIPPVHDYAERIARLAATHDRVIVEGAGGLLVRLDTEGGTLLDIAAGTGAEVVLVCAAGLGTLNHTELTVAALRARGIEPAGLVVGAWPSAPGLAESCNRDDLPAHTGVPLLAVIPEGAGTLDRETFATASPHWWQ
ncbi:MAG: dethiobiotin synthase [Nocardioides sp.]